MYAVRMTGFGHGFMLSGRMGIVDQSGPLEVDLRLDTTGRKTDVSAGRTVVDAVRTIIRFRQSLT